MNTYTWSGKELKPKSGANNITDLDRDIYEKKSIDSYTMSSFIMPRARKGLYAKRKRRS